MDAIEQIREDLWSADPSLRRSACETIEESRDKAFIQDLVTRLKDEDHGVKEAALNALAAIGGTDVAEAIAPLLKTDDASLRNIGVEALGLIGHDAIGAISALLNDADDGVVKFAVDILAKIKDERAVSMLTGLIRHRNPNVRSAVAVCLGMINAAGSVPVLLEALDDTEEWVRFSAVEGLGLSGDTRALGPLLSIIDGRSGSIVEAAVEALGKIVASGDAAMVLEKIEGLAKSGHLFTISAVAELLEKAQAPGSNFHPSRELKETYFNFFSDNLDDSEKAVRINALKGLGLLRLPKGLKRVLEFAESLKEIDEETETLIVDAIVSIAGRGPLSELLRSELKRHGKSFDPVVKALSELRSEAAAPLLEDAIDRVTKHEQRDVVNAIASIGSPASHGALKKCLGSADGHTRKIAARALASISGDGAAESLMAALKKEVYRDVMEEITDTLATIPSETVRSGFGELLKSEREILREMGARGLGLIGDGSAVELLGHAVKDPSPAVRRTAYQSIAKLGIPDTADIVISGLDDADDGVRRALLKALSGWPCDNIRDGIAKALKDSNLWARRQAVILVGETCGVEFEGTLIEMLKRDEPPVKAAAACALEKIGTSTSVPVLEEFLNHPDPSVRAAVKNALGSMQC